jgi:hypothetical protein
VSPAPRQPFEPRTTGQQVGRCACGCGLPTNIAPYTSRRCGWVKGQPLKYVLGHAARGRGVKGDPCLVQPRQCECGCGKYTPIATATDPRCGHIKGQPIRFLRGHPSKLQPRQEKSFSWRSGSVGYAAVHRRLGFTRGKTCVDCGEPARELSLRKNTPKDRLKKGFRYGRPVRFSVSLSDYDPRCKSCHGIYDGIQKLTADQAKEIRRLAHSGFTQRSIAEKFGVCQSRVSQIVSGRAKRKTILSTGGN